MKYLFGLLLGLCFATSVTYAQQKEQRIALVIGNSAYKVSPLKNPVNDARDMANSLRGYGFSVIERNNLTVKQIGSTLREFRSKLTAGSVALVFYAGHGIQIKGENYLPAVDAEIVGEEDVPNQSLSTRQIMDVLSDAKSRMNLVFLDACRDNPFARSFRSSSRGLGRENAPSGTLISFATRPGSTAADGDGRNGLYTSVLLQQIKNTDQPIEQVLKRVVTGVKTASKGQQEPWMEGSIEGDFCFGKCGAVTVYTSSNQQFVADSIKPVQKSFKDCEDCPEMVVIPSGSYLMGSRPDPFAKIQNSLDELPQHNVSISSFAIGKFEVTQEQWYALMGNLPSNYKGRQLPVEQVSWDDAQEFIAKLNAKTGKKYRLPSESEWEYASRAGSISLYHFGDDEKQLGLYAWYFDGSRAPPNSMQTHLVGEKLSNSFGLHDMHGNVWEWTQDCWNENYINAPSDGSPWLYGDCNRRVIRGGSWFSGAQSARSAHRGRTLKSTRDSAFGFRVARDN